MKIHKYRLYEMEGTEVIESFQGAKILSAGLDRDKQLCVWAIVDPMNSKKNLTVEVVFTGRAPKECFEFVGTVTSDLVYHVFK